MSIEEIIKNLEKLASAEEKDGCYIVDMYASDIIDTAKAVVPMLRTHPEAQPNDPLTLEELREMEGWPVWTVTKGISDPGRWELVIDAECEDRLEMAERADGFYEIDTDSYGKTWLAYRRRRGAGAAWAVDTC